MSDGHDDLAPAVAHAVMRILSLESTVAYALESIRGIGMTSVEVALEAALDPSSGVDADAAAGEAAFNGEAETSAKSPAPHSPLQDGDYVSLASTEGEYADGLIVGVNGSRARVVWFDIQAVTVIGVDALVRRKPARKSVRNRLSR